MEDYVALDIQEANLALVLLSFDEILQRYRCRTGRHCPQGFQQNKNIWAKVMGAIC